MPRKRTKRDQGDMRVWAEKVVTANLGGYQSYKVTYGLEGPLLEGETPRDGMLRLKEQIEEQVNEDLSEIDDVRRMIPHTDKKGGKK